jgi:phage terminase large subunit-like protein
MNRGIEYAKEIVSGKVIACELEYLACKRFLEDLEKKDFEYIFDVTRAERIINFIEKNCCHVKGVYTGKTIDLLPFQVFDLINIYIVYFIVVLIFIVYNLYLFVL